MRAQLITLNYIGKSKDIQLVVRDETGERRVLSITNFEPYMYVRDSDAFDQPQNRYVVKTEYGYKSLFGKSLVKLVMTDPLGVSKLRDSYEEHYEADIPFVRRFLIDTGITNGLEYPTGRDTIHWSDVKPSDYINNELRCVTLDIEVDPTGFTKAEDLLKAASNPVIAVTIHDSLTDIYVTIVLDDKEGQEWWSPNHLVIRVTREYDLLSQIGAILDAIKPDVIRNWNVYFDLDYLRPRSRKLGLDLSKQIDLSAHFDQLTAYKKIFKKGSNRLKDVVIEEGITDSVVSEEFHFGLYQDRKTRDLFIKYNANDVRYCVEIDRMHRLTQSYWYLKISTGLETFSPTFYTSTLVDVLALREAYESNEVLPTGNHDWEGDDDDESSFEGATVFNPEIGKDRGVAVMDMSKFYPSIIRAWRMSPETRSGNGILCRIVRRIAKVRENVDREVAETREKYGADSKEYDAIEDKKTAIKNITSATWGYIGYEGSRLFMKELAEEVARHAREGLQYLKYLITSGEYVSPLDGQHHAYKTKYGDTDSIHIKMPKEEAPHLAKWLNEKLKEYCIAQGAEPLLKLSYEKYLMTETFTEGKEKGKAAKKHYIMRVIEIDGKPADRFDWRGYDRRDSSRIGRATRKEIAKMIAYDRESEIKPYLAEVIRKVKEYPRGEYKLRDICMNQGISKDPEQYAEPHDVVRGAIYSNKFLGLHIQGGDTLKMLPVLKVPGHPPTDVISVIDEEQVPEGTVIDIDELIRKTFRIKLEPMLKVADINFDSLNKRSIGGIYSQQSTPAPTPTPKTEVYVK